MQRNHENHESLEPHPRVRAHRDEEDRIDISSEGAHPHELRHNDVTGEHRPGSPPIRTEVAVQKRKPLKWIRAVVRHKKLHAVGVPNDRTGEQQELAHDVYVIPGHHIVKLVKRARWQQQGQHHRKSSEDSSRDKVWGKIVVCHPGRIEVAESNDTVECTDKTSGVEIPAKTR